MGDLFKKEKPQIGSGPIAPGASQDPFEAKQPFDLALPTGQTRFDPDAGKITVDRVPQPVTFQLPGGGVRFDPTTNTFTAQESDAARSLRESRDSKRLEILQGLDVLGPGRVAQLEEFKQTFFDELVTLTVDPAERAEIQAGRAGTPLEEKISRLRTQAGTQSIFAKEELARSEINQRLQSLGLLEQHAAQDKQTDIARAGLGVAGVELGQAGERLSLAQAGLAQEDVLNQRAFGEARRNALLNAEMQRFGIAVNQNSRRQEALLSAGGDAVGAITTVATLKAMTGTCLFEDTKVLCPNRGWRPISELRTGDEVFTIHDDRLVVRPIVRRSETIMDGHPMCVMTVHFAEGPPLKGSSQHPLSTGKTLSSLWPGDLVDGKEVTRIEIETAKVCQMHDILPDSETGFYIANGVWVGSMLKEALVYG